MTSLIARIHCRNGIRPQLPALTLIIIGLLISSLALGQNIIEIERGDTPARLYIDFDSIRKTDEGVQFWYILDVYVAHDRAGTRVYGEQVLQPLEHYKSNMVEVIMQCDAGTWSLTRVKSFTEARADGTMTASHIVPPSERKQQKIVNGSTLEQLAKYVCHD